jgi:hypothetical protein
MARAESAPPQSSVRKAWSMYKSLSAQALCLLSTAQSHAAAATPCAGERRPLRFGPRPPHCRPSAYGKEVAARQPKPCRKQGQGSVRPPICARSRPHGARADGRRAGKNEAVTATPSAAGRWEPGSHTSKRDWSRTCRRIENRLEGLHVETLDVDRTTPSARKKGRARRGALKAGRPRPAEAARPCSHRIYGLIRPTAGEWPTFVPARQAT